MPGESGPAASHGGCSSTAASTTRAASCSRERRLLPDLFAGQTSQRACLWSAARPQRIQAIKQLASARDRCCVDFRGEYFLLAKEDCCRLVVVFPVKSRVSWMPASWRLWSKRWLASIWRQANGFTQTEEENFFNTQRQKTSATQRGAVFKGSFFIAVA